MVWRDTVIRTGKSGCRNLMHQLHCVHSRKVERASAGLQLCQLLHSCLFMWRAQPMDVVWGSEWGLTWTPHLSFQLIAHSFSLMVLISLTLQAAFTELFLLPTVNLMRLFLRLHTCCSVNLTESIEQNPCHTYPGPDRVHFVSITSTVHAFGFHTPTRMAH